MEEEGVLCNEANKEQQDVLVSFKQTKQEARLGVSPTLHGLRRFPVVRPTQQAVRLFATVSFGAIAAGIFQFLWWNKYAPPRTAFRQTHHQSEVF